MKKVFVTIGILILILSLPIANAQTYQITGNYTSSSGDITTFDEMDGSYVLLDAMYTTCGPCRIEMLHLKDIKGVIDDYEGDEEIKMISISMKPDIDSIEKVGEFMAEFEATWDYGLDHNEELFNYFNPQGFPTTYFISPQGEIIKSWLGITEPDVILDEMDKYLDLPGGFVRENNLDQILGDLLNSPFFYVFIVMLWIFIMYSGFKLIDKISSKSKDVNRSNELEK